MQKYIDQNEDIVLITLLHENYSINYLCGSQNDHIYRSRYRFTPTNAYIDLYTDICRQTLDINI